MDTRMSRIDPQHESRRIQRRVWFTLHVVVIALVNLIYTPDPLLMTVKSLLLSTIFIHFYWLYMIGLYETTMQTITERAYAAIEDMTPQSLPLLGDGQRCVVKHQQNDFWYRWHDV